MKKETLLEIILGTIGGLIFAIGMCVCLMPEWNLLKTGVIISILGLITLLFIIPIYTKNHPKKDRGPLNWGDNIYMDNRYSRFINYGIWHE